MLKYTPLFSAKDFLHICEEQREHIEQTLLALNDTLQLDYLFLSVVDDDKSNATTTITLNNNKVIENFSYPLAQSPCDNAITGTYCEYLDVAKHFPMDKLLTDMGIQTYVGTSLLDTAGHPCGLLVGLQQQDRSLNDVEKALFTQTGEYLGVFCQKSFFENSANERLTLFEAVERIANVGAWQLELSTETLFWTEEVYRIYGMPVNTPIIKNEAISCYREQDAQIIAERLATLISTGKPYKEELQFVDTQGHAKWVRTTGYVDRNHHGDIVRVYGTFEDISNERQALLAQQARKNRLETILNNLNDAVITINEKGIIKHCNVVAQKIFGYAESELLGNRINLLMPPPYCDEHDRYLEHYRQTGEANIIGKGRQLPAVRKNGEIFQMELALTKVEKESETEFIGIVRDISERISAEDKIYNMAYTDTITGLKNRRWFEQELRDELKRNEHLPKYIGLIDIDGIAQLNLKYSVDIGDEVINTVGVTLATRLPSNFKLYKNGADSFYISSANDDITDTQWSQLHQDTVQGLLSKVIVQGEDYQETITFSLGSMICYPQHESFESILDSLEYALSTAKETKPSGECFLTADALKGYRRKKAILTALHSGSVFNELSVVLQPQYDSTNSLCSSEALLRWYSSQLGFVSPAEFIPLAEESGIIIAIGDWVLDRVCELLSSLYQQGIQTCVAVNISAKQIIADDFSDKLMDCIQRWSLPPTALVIELTETALVADVDVVKQTMQYLNDQGFSFSIDDFGTGYSSLAYLQVLPISEIKIDKYFVDDIIDADAQHPALIVNVVLGMAKALNVRCVAEGVEASEQVEYLKARGCEIFQGYYFDKPLLTDVWLAKIRQQHKTSGK